MQSDSAGEAEAEISSVPTKTTHRNEKYSADNNYGQTRTSSKSNRLLSSFKSEDVIAREMTHSTTDSSKGFAESYSRANPNANPILEQDKLTKQTISNIASPRKEEKTAGNDIPFDQANDDLASRGGNGKKATSTRTYLGAGSGNHPSTADYGNTRNSKVSNFKDSHYSPVSTKLESSYISSPEHSSSQPNISVNSRDEKSCQSRRRSEVTDSENNDLVENGGRFIVPPPKYSNLYSIALDHEGASSSTALYKKKQNDVRTSSRFSSIPQQTFEREKVLTPSSIQQQQENTNNENGDEVGTNIIHDEHSNTITHELGKNDDDTIFNFPEKEKLIRKIEQDRDEKYEKGEKSLNKNFKARRRSRQRRKERIPVDTAFSDDELSMENYGAVSALHATELQERAHQAWKSRQRKNSTIRSKHDSKSPPDKSSIVSFGASDTIHHFDAGVLNQNQYKNEDEDNVSLDRTLNSEYTKTLESEVEDMIKDILFIGNPEKSKPGRRKYRHKPEVERKLCEDRTSKAIMETGAQIVECDRRVVLNETIIENVEDDPYATTALTSKKVGKKSVSKRGHRLARSQYRAQTSEESTISRGSSVDSNTVETFQSEKDNIEDPLNTVLGFVEGGLSVMTSAIGYALGDHTGTETQEHTQEHANDDCHKATSDYDIFESCGIHARNQKLVTKSDGKTETRATNEPSKMVWVARNSVVDPIGPNNALLRSKKVKRKSEASEEQDHDKRLIIDNQNESGHQTSNIGDGSELVRLALYAARSVHKLRGVEYDESFAIDMYKEVKKCHVTLELPLGSKYSFTTNVSLITIFQINCSFLFCIFLKNMHQQLFSLRMMVRLKLENCFDELFFLLSICNKIPHQHVCDNIGGCFVTKVSPDGSAARSRGVLVGDQLASINGSSSSKMKVDDICDAIGRCTDPSQIKLIFLRYVGPFRPSAKALLSEDVAEKICDTSGNKYRNLNTSRNKKPVKKITGFRLFGKGKKNKT